MKKTVSELFLSSAQVPSPGFESKPLSEDGLAIFRIAKEFALTREIAETKSIDAEDLARLLRFAGWLLTYGGTPVGGTSPGSSQGLRSLFAHLVLQAQAQFSGFEALLRSYGVDRQLDPSLVRTHRRKQSSSASDTGGAPQEKSAGLVVGRTTRLQQIQVRIHEKGTELTSTTAESNWTAQGWRKQDN